MKEMPTDDPLFGKGTIRADGRKIHPAYLVEVKKPAESKGPWDYYKVRATIPGRPGVPAAEGRRVPAGEVRCNRDAVALQRPLRVRGEDAPQAGADVAHDRNLRHPARRRCSASC